MWSGCFNVSDSTAGSYIIPGYTELMIISITPFYYMEKWNKHIPQ